MNPGTCGNGLEIGERLDIAIDVAHAITYLHTYSGNTIYGCKMVACIVQFRCFNQGIALFMDDMQQSFNSDHKTITNCLLSNILSFLISP